MKAMRVALFGAGAMFIFAYCFQIPIGQSALLAMPGMWVDWKS